MGNNDNMAEWVCREHTKGSIDRAGALLIPWWIGKDRPEDLGTLFGIVENWRTSHSYPLNAFQNNLRFRAKRIENTALIAQLLKRFSSVMDELTREPNMKLSQMHDLGGCRAIMSSIQSVDELFNLYGRSLVSGKVLCKN